MFFSAFVVVAIASFAKARDESLRGANVASQPVVSDDAPLARDHFASVLLNLSEDQVCHSLLQ